MGPYKDLICSYEKRRRGAAFPSSGKRREEDHKRAWPFSRSSTLMHDEESRSSRFVPVREKGRKKKSFRGGEGERPGGAAYLKEFLKQKAVVERGGKREGFFRSAGESRWSPTRRISPQGGLGFSEREEKPCPVEERHRSLSRSPREGPEKEREKVPAVGDWPPAFLDQ